MYTFCLLAVTSNRRDREETNSSLKTYAIKYPEELNDAMPQVGTECYAYEVTMEAHYDRNDYTSHIYDSLQTRRNYALLLRKRLPRLAEMPLFNHQGKMHVHVAEEPSKVVIQTEEQLEQLQHFHVMIFRDILRIWQPFFVLDRHSNENCFLVVPLSATPGVGIDWPLVEHFQRLPKAQARSLAERHQMPPPNPQDYVGTVVTQWYANYDEKRMMVTKVHTDLSPLSMMEEKQQGKSYYEFTMAKYRNYIGDVVHKQQFLLEVRELSDQLNFYVQQRVKSSAQSKARAKVMLIPELCFNFGFPGDLWVKLLFLPSILRRLHFMLHAETLRVRINEYLGLDKMPQNGVDYRPRALEIDWSLRRNVDHQGNAMHADDCEEPRPLLEPLPTKGVEKAMERLNITDLEVPWQQYMEPRDIDRNVMTTYPVELSYFFNFTRGKNNCFDKMEDDDKELWTQRQFKMSEGNIYSCQARSNKLPALMPASMDNGQRVEQVVLSVLQHSISNEHITPAEQGEYLAAITYAGSVDVFDMERFELLGDCFLKLSATLYLANKYPDWNEGILTQVSIYIYNQPIKLVDLSL